MTKQINPTHTNSEVTARENGVVLDERTLVAAWTRAAKAECQLQLLRDLRKAKTGVAEIEEFVDNLEDAKKNKKVKRKVKTRDADLVKRIMDRKVIDAEIVQKETETRKRRLKKKIEEIHGKNSKKTKTVIKKLRKEAANEKKEIKENHSQKENHLRNKYVNKKKNNDTEVPENLRRYRNLSIFKKKKVMEGEAKENEIQEANITIIGTVVDEDEKSFLRLGKVPKTS